MCFAAAAILRSTEVAPRSQLTTQLQSRRLGTSSCNPAWQASRTIANACAGPCQCLIGSREFLLKVFREIELALQLRAHFSSLIFQKCSEREVKSAFRTKSNFRCSFMRFSDLSFQQWSENASFLRFWRPANQAPATVPSTLLLVCLCVCVDVCVCAVCVCKCTYITTAQDMQNSAFCNAVSPKYWSSCWLEEACLACRSV